MVGSISLAHRIVFVFQCCELAGHLASERFVHLGRRREINGKHALACAVRVTYASAKLRVLHLQLLLVLEALREPLTLFRCATLTCIGLCTNADGSAYTCIIYNPDTILASPHANNRNF